MCVLDWMGISAGAWDCSLRFILLTANHVTAYFRSFYRVA